MKRDLWSGMEPAINDTPERNLWFAVIERAVKDYIGFFEKTTVTKAGHLASYHFITPRKTDNFCLKAIFELERLRWFLFSKEKEMFNLEYLAEQLYEDGSGSAWKIRKEAHNKFLTCLTEARDLESLSPIISHIYENMSELTKKI